MQNVNLGLLGELEVEQRLVERGWHPVRLDTAQMASNADLLAIDRERRVSIQVKATNAGARHSHSDYLGFGYSTGYLQDKLSVFNSKQSPLIADVVVGVAYAPGESRYVVLPVGLAENLCRLHCDYWRSVPVRKSDERSNSFPIYLCFAANPKSHADHHLRIKRNLIAYENAWSILDKSPEELRDRACWPIAD
jgi:hypothetical protein